MEVGDRASRPDSDEPAELMGCHLDELRRYANLRMGPLLRARTSSEDIVQSACADVLRQMKELEYRGAAEFRSFLFRAVDLKLRDRRRFENALRRTPDREAGDPSGVTHSRTPSRGAQYQEERSRFDEALEAMPEVERLVLRLVCLEGLPHSEAANRLGRTPKAVRNLLCRAKARLTTLLTASG